MAFSDLVDMLERRGSAPGDAGFVFLDDGEREGARLSHRQLAQRARAIAAALQARGLAGERVLLMFPPGLEFIEAFFGCVYAGALAVPVYPPDPARLDRTLPRLEAIARDAEASALLSTQRVLSMAEHLLPRAPGLASLQRLASDAVEDGRAADWRRPAVDADAIAFLQYTSGSTALPRGVRVSHANLLHNQAQIERAFRWDVNPVAVSWLPLFHDMGLIGMVLQPVHGGRQVYLLSPLDFLAKPVRWLQAISRYRAHDSGGPDFAYELCVRKVGEAEAAGLDLSSWRRAFSGAEPVRAETLDRFAERFGPAGFRREAFYPCYGLAEATLFVTGRSSAEAPRRLTVDAGALAEGRVVVSATGTRTLVSCGHAWLGQEVAIASPEGGARLPEGVVGEIRVRGPSVARGYFGNEEESARVFGAHLDGEGAWLRTGDLGFLLDGELYVTGRLKDVIIVAGRNHYPQDLEWTLERADARVRRGCAACFALEVDGGERLAAAVEVDERRGPIDAEALAATLRAAIAERHGLRLHALALVRAGGVPKTSSGKIQRSACREAFLRGTLDEVARSATPRPPEGAREEAQLGRIEDLLRRTLRRVLADPGVTVAPDEPLAHLGLGSLDVAELKSALEEALGRTVPLAWLAEASTLRDLARTLAREHVETETDGGSEIDPWTEHVNPYLARQLRAFRLDKRYVRGEGCHVEDDAGRRYLDFTAAYGALPFGFNPPEIWAAILDAARAAPASLVQPSLLDGAGRLARRLVELAPPGLRYVTFANSGAEANEAAIKMARSATGRMGIVSTDGGFHGKTLGALSATGRDPLQRAFGAPAPGFTRVPFGDLAALGEVLDRQGREIAAVMLEPIQGEGGIRVAPDGYLRGVRALCDRHGVLLVLDEVQTGLGRTGALFACEHEGVVPDAMTLAKALGGGLVPIGAVLSTSACFNEEFALRHSSTFAGNALAATVGLRSLELLTRDDRALVRHVAEVGAELRDGLLRLQRRFPALIRDVRGRGFMLGVELTDDHGAFGRQGLPASMAEQGTLAWLLCSYLLHVEGIRIAPALIGSRVLRIEPPLVATRAMCAQVVGALERCFERLAACDTAALVGHLVERAPAPHVGPAPRRRVARPAPDEGRWGFVFHPLDHRSYADFDAGLAGFGDGELRALMERLRGAPLRDTSPALLIGAGRIETPGARAYGELFAVTATAEELHAMPAAEAVARVREAVALARDRGARIVGLGAYTSIVTKNGEWLDDVGVPITTGNGLTVVAAVDIVLRASRELGLPLAESTVAIVGATGSIGRAVAIELAPLVGRLVLVGNPAHRGQALLRLRRIAADVVLALRGASGVPGTLAARVAPTGSPEAEAGRLVDDGRLVLLADEAADLTLASVVVAATSSPRALLTAAQLGPGALVCDVSQPANVSPDLATERPDVLALQGGGVALPRGQDLGVGFGLAPGLLYACMAETALLALDRRYRHGSLGSDLPHDLIADLRALSRRHDFQVVPVRAGRPLDAADWQRARLARG
jgi:acetylornithine/succinyldiaminopimelate/putrescine aminotransferase/acyl-CoA synthetase (AMP-forming)/AMP-acid ligase II/predicted amino acid dehydrogenase